MEGRSAATAGLISSEDISSEDMGKDYFYLSQKKSPGERAGAWKIPLALRERSVALTEQLQEQREQVDEVQIERQRAGDGRTFRHFAALLGIAIDVFVLQPLGIPGSK